MLPSDFPFPYNIIYESVTATINAIVSINRYPHNPHFTQELDILIRDVTRHESNERVCRHYDISGGM